MVRITRDGDLPLHFEASPLKSWAVAVGWPAALVACTAGVAVFVRAGSALVEAVAALLIFIGGSMAVALVRCRRYEITVGKRMIELRAGPFNRLLPVGAVEAVKAGPATSWRRLYADLEAELVVGIEARSVVVPTNDEDELRRALLRE